jgi:alpha,alpha-trehalose phosphorylase
LVHPLAGYAKDRRIVLVHGTQRTQMSLACAIDHDFECDCSYHSKTDHTENGGQVVFSIAAKPGHSIHLTKYMVYHTAKSATPDELCRSAEWTMDRITALGFGKILADQESVLANQ